MVQLTTAIIFYYTNVDYLIIEATLGYSVAGLYYGAYRYPHYIHQLQYLVSTVVFPAFTKVADRRQLEAAAALGAPVVELHTGAWCEAMLEDPASAVAAP